MRNSSTILPDSDSDSDSDLWEKKKNSVEDEGWKEDKRRRNALLVSRRGMRYYIYSYSLLAYSGVEWSGVDGWMEWKGVRVNTEFRTGVE